MMSRPLSLRQPAIDAFLAGTLRRLRRPIPGVFAKAQPGDVVWVREPFHLDARWDGMAPTAAIGLGARVTFSADLAKGEARELGLGPERAARTLPKSCHRQHALIRFVDREPLQRITAAEAQAEGFRDRAAWAADWDRQLMGFSTRPDHRLWQRDPTVIVLTLDRIASPLPKET